MPPDSKSPFDPAARLVIATTAAVGVIVALASEIPAAARSPVLLLALLIWMAAVAWGAGQAVRSVWAPGMNWSAWSSAALGAAGIAVATLSLLQLELIRAVGARPGLVWNVDWRWAWNHAQTIARFVSVDRALDYAGVPVDYHVGPAWLAGATQRLLGWGLTEVLFGIVPALCVLSTAAALLLLLTNSGVPRRLAAATVGVALCLPAVFKLLRMPPRLSDLYDADTWLFAPGLMPNSLLAIAVGFCGLGLLLDRRQRVAGTILGTAGFAALIQIKPQFFVGLGMVVGLVGLGRAVGVRPFAPRSWTVLAASVGALALAFLAHVGLPHSVIRFSAPEWTPGSTGFRFRLAQHVPPAALALLVILGLSMWLGRSRSGVWSSMRPRPWRLVEILSASVMAFVVLSTVLAVISFPVQSDLVARADAVGVTSLAKATQRDLAQALMPLRLLLSVTSIGGLVLLWTPQRSMRLLPVAVAGLIIVSPLPRIALHFVQPLRGYEAVEDRALLTLLGHIPQDDELLIANDLADAADDYARPLRNPILTAYGGHILYVSNLEYEHHARVDAVQRLHGLHAFFGSAWSSWHEAWLRRARITHVLVSDRCLPRWWGEAHIPLEVVERSGRWTLLRLRGLTAESGAVPPAWEPVPPRYGQAPCLGSVSPPRQ